MTTATTSIVLPEATPRPCSDCPWRRSSTRGWLGPLSAEDWVALAHAEAPIACHQTIKVDGEWAPGTLQCRGAAIFRANICKSPRDPQIVKGPRDTKTVFAWNDEFLEHHDSPLATWLAESREREEVVEATHVRCFECNTDTEIEPGDTAEDTACFVCEENGQDPWIVGPVAIIECPNGVTASAWKPGGYIDGQGCDDDNHEPRSGLHIIDLEND